LARRSVSIGYRYTIFDDPKYLASARRFSHSGLRKSLRALAAYTLAEIRRLI
jgi:hypothetical protein